MSKQKLLQITRRAQDLGQRLGVDTEIVVTHSQRGEHAFEEYSLKFPECTLEQISDLLEWLDYYVPTSDEQALRQYGAMVCDFVAEGVVPKLPKGGAA